LNSGQLFLSDKPKCLGMRLVVASGQIFLQTPVANTNNAGATGIRIFQNKSNPILGKIPSRS